MYILNLMLVPFGRAKYKNLLVIKIKLAVFRHGYAFILIYTGKKKKAAFGGWNGFQRRRSIASTITGAVARDVGRRAETVHGDIGGDHQSAGVSSNPSIRGPARP